MYIMPAVSWTYVRVEEEHGDLVKFKVCLLNASIHHTRCAHDQNLFFFKKKTETVGSSSGN
jgi:hypothetical protein